MLREIKEPVTYFSATPNYDLGELYYDDRSAKVYRYVACAAAATNNALAAGEYCCADTGGAWIVNNDVTGGTGMGTEPMGIAISAIPENYYGWIQVGGMAAVTITDGSVAAGEYIMPHATTDGGVDTMADGSEESVFAFTNQADVGNTCTIQLKGLI